MPRTPIHSPDIVAAIVAALNGATINGGTLSAKANGQEVLIYTHADAPGGSYNKQWTAKVQ